MSDLINDGHLVGFWPLDEPSGAPLFQNRSLTYGGKPSGISFDLHVQQNITQNATHGLSEWPGVTTIFSSSSGTDYNGLQLHGTYQATGLGRHSKALSVGMGTTANRLVTVGPQIAQSGFTFGLWVLPQSNGYDGFVDGTDNSSKQHSLGNSLFGRGEDDNGIWVGVSGEISRGAQINNSDPEHRVLKGYLFVTGADADNPSVSSSAELLETPIESDRFTHLTGSFRYVDGTSNEVVLYKDGRVEASGVTDRDLTSSLANFVNAYWTIGGAVDDNAATTADRYPHVNGWNHLVSGAYLFNRVLHEGEVLDMHQAGGLQSSLGFSYGELPQLSLADSSLLAYYPFSQVGYPDVSRNHQPLIARLDEGDRSELSVTPGPFENGGVYKVDGADQLVATSGLTFNFAESPSFTLSMWFMQPQSSTYISNMLASIGSTDDILNPVVSTSTLGFHVSRDTIDGNDKLFVRAYPDGTTGSELRLTAIDGDQKSQVGTHCSVVYDNQTLGLALYANGEFQSSGTLSRSLSDQCLGLASSGFPLMFLNGVLDDNPETTDTAAATNACLFNIAIHSRPLRADEIASLALSGVDTAPIKRSAHDPRLVGFWPCTDFNGDDVVIEDRASVWSSTPGYLTNNISDDVWDEIETTDDEGPWYRRDIFPTSSDTLGITGSGTFTVLGGSRGSQPHTSANSDARSSIANFCLRYKANTEDNDFISNHYLGEWILGFEVTPGSDVPDVQNLNQASAPQFNSMIHNWGDTSNNFYSYLTTVAHTVGQAPGSSGVSIAFVGQEGGNVNPLVSGQLPSTTNNVMLHLRWEDPYSLENSVSEAGIILSLYINGNFAHRKRVFSNTAYLWANDSPLSDDFILQFGGRALDESPITKSSVYTGLGSIHLRNIFMMRGAFSQDDIEYLAASGIGQSTSLGGYGTGAPSTTQVTLADSDLIGYYRFSGAESGELDLSTNMNDLVPIAKERIEKDNTLAGTNIEAAYNLRYLPGPLRNSDLGVRASGITYAGDNFSANVIAPFVTSGVGFQNPGAGFSVGFLMSKRAAVSSNDVTVPLSYGVTPNSISTTAAQPNAGWAVVVDEDESVKMVLSNGSMTLEDITSPAPDQIHAGVHFISHPYDVSAFEKFKHGAFGPPHIDALNHYAWTYDATTNRLKCYFNGFLVDEQTAEGVQNPTDPSSRFISLLVPQEDTPWDFGNARAEFDGYITDVFYFQDTLTDREVQYIAFNGIDQATGTATSGHIGGFVHGQDTGSGIIAGYLRALETGSGIIGGYMPGSIEVSGIIGGYVSGVVFATGSIGAYVQGLETGSGIIGGYLTGSELGSGIIGGLMRAGDVGSGILGGYITGSTPGSGILGGFVLGSLQPSGMIGGWILGGLQGNLQFDTSYTVQAIAAADYDAMLEARQENASDFDAKVVVFQSEIPPEVGIIIPGQTVTGQSPPFNQYFIGKASGLQGKTITSTKWTFGDLSPTVSVAESGAGCYPVQHRYATSGIFMAKFEVIDSHGVHNSATRIINAASGIPEVIVTLSGVPRSGNAALIVDFDTNIESLPPGVSISTQLLIFDDGQTTTAFNPTHAYTEPGIYKPVWCVRDSRGFLWCDTLQSGHDQ